MYRQSAFGALSDGRPAQLFTLDNGLLTLSVTDYGATAVRLTVPDRGGAPTDVLLGYDSAAAYERDDKYLGATVGRCANRIGGDYDNSFDVDGFDGRLRAFAELRCDATGISLAARTDRPAFQLYTGAFLSGAYAPGDGVCLETQYPPNAVNTPFGPVPLLRGGETARSVTEYAFGTF